MKKARALWRGEVSLTEAFWHWAVFWGVLANAVTSALFLVLVLNDMHPALLVPAYLLPLPYNVFVCVAVWRSAAAYGGPAHHAELARWITLLGAILLSAT